MAENGLLDDLFEQIKVARRERRRVLQANVAFVKRMRADVRRHQADLRRQLAQSARFTQRSLRRFVEHNRIGTQRLLSNARSARSRYAMRLRFENTSTNGQRKRQVNGILRTSASQRRLGEMQRRRSTASQLSTIKAFVQNLHHGNRVHR